MSRTTRSAGLSLDSLTGAHWVAIALTAATGLVHLYLYVVEGFLPFLLGGVGYLAAIVLFALGVRRRLLYLAGVVYVLVHVVGWVAAGMPTGGWTLTGAEFVTLGTADKLVEVALLGVLVYLYRVDAPTTAYRIQGQRAD